MHNFSIEFSYPWLLLLLVPAVVLTLLPYFKLSKRYRRTRNRITSIVLHLTIMVLAISALAGMKFHYQIPNHENEILLLVDVSDTEEQAADTRDEFVQTVLQDSRYDNYKVGVVTFGFDQQYAVPLTAEVDGIFGKYLDAKLPDTSATNIASALSYAKGLFEYPETAKIVLITDGKETDEEASLVIRSVVAQGTKVDTVYIPSAYEGNDIQIIGVELPDYHVNALEECSFNITVQSQYATTVTFDLLDNGEESETGTGTFELIQGKQTVTLKHTFKDPGLHDLTFRMTVVDDLLEENNTYNAYLNLEVFNKLLILNSEEGASEKLEEMINKEKYYVIDSKNIIDEDVPTTVDELRAYDQVILNNIANYNMPEGFDVILESYVRDFGGGLFTVGGNDASGNANAYNRTDMYGTLYQQMLPVEAINYTPPVGVVIIIDRSGSMGGDGSSTKLDWAKAGASSCLDALTDRDYLSIMTLDDEHSTILSLTPCTQKAKILAAINSIETAEGATIFPGAIERAGQSLQALQNVDKRHIIIVTDGEVPVEQVEDYEMLIDTFYKNAGITLSIVGIEMQKGSKAYTQMKSAADLGHGRLITAKSEELVRLMREELKAPEIKEVNYKTFNPILNNLTSPLVQGLDRGTGENKDRLTVTLDGFYGVKVRETADLVLVGEFSVPLYAQWKYGVGMVGSFMCDLKGTGDSWSIEFMNDSNGKQFITNVINNLMPTENIRPNEIKADLKEDNYTNKLSIYTTLEEGETIKGELIQITSSGEVTTSLNSVTAGTKEQLRTLPCYVTAALNENNNYSRCDFVVRKSGVYKLVLTKVNKDGKQVADSLVFYKSFAYSEEYDVYAEDTEITPEQSLETLAARGEGAKVADLENPWEIFDGFVTAIDRYYDPRFLFMILSLVLFLLDIAVRKFKFKWPHEIIRDIKEKKKKSK
ncbi:MAG: VWA domain-containing protein [Clostridia bacterium]|nr:VWA domain-containing protein [Clostridia bacterium]